MTQWNKTSALWGGFWGLLLGSAFLPIPGMGPLLASRRVGVLRGVVVVGGVGALGAGLFSSENSE